MKTSLVKLLLPLAFSIFNFQFSLAQLYVDGTSLYVQKNAVVKVETNLVTAKPGATPPKIRNWGTIAVEGNTQFHKDTDYKGQGDLCLLGSSQQSLTTNGIPLKKLDIRNSNNVELGDSMNIQGELKLTSGFLLLGNHNLTIDDSVTITGGSDSSYLRINGTGKVTRKGGSGVVFPIGYNPYAPVTIDCSSCGSVDFTIGVADNVYDNPVASTGQKTTNVVDQQWNITSSSSLSNVSITLGWEQSQETTGFTRTASGIGHWESGVSSSWNAQSPTTASGSNPYSLSKTLSSMSTNTYYFGIGSNGSALPVELTYFTAEWVTSASLSNPIQKKPGGLSGAEAQLTWQTAMEEDNSHFEIQRTLRSSSGVEMSGPTNRSEAQENWQTIATIEGAGNSIRPINYTYTDQLETSNQKPETIYYRLKQVDYNGNFEYSEIRTLNLKSQIFNSVSIYPNPASDRVNIKSSSPINTIEVYNLQGQLLKQVHNTQTLHVNDLPKGQYLLKVSNGENTTQHKILVS